MIVSVGRVAQRLMNMTGRDAVLDPSIPTSALIREIRVRAVALVRGWLRLRTNVFLGRHTEFKGKRHIYAGRFSSIGAFCNIDGYSRDGVHIGRGSRLGRGCVITSTSHLAHFGRGFQLGQRSGIGDFAHIGCSGGVVIGDDVIIGPYVTFHSQEHVFDDPDRLIRLQGTTQRGIHVASDVWIGARCTILDGTEIGQHSVVAAGSVVKGSFPAHSLIGGVPARVLRNL